MDWATAISAGSSVLGDILGKKGSVGGQLRTQYHEARVAEEKRYLSTRRGAEKAGINPLLVMGGPALPMPSVDASGPTMGSTIADLGMIVADGMNRREDLARATAAEKENDRLRGQVKELTLRPKVAGIYGGAGAFGLGVNPRPVGPGAVHQAPRGAESIPAPSSPGYARNGEDGLPTFAAPGELPSLDDDVYNAVRVGSEVVDPVVNEVLNRNFFSPEYREEQKKDWIDRSAPVPSLMRGIGLKPHWERVTRVPKPVRREVPAPYLRRAY